MPTELTDEELIDMPAGNLRPGELSRAFLVKAEHTRKILEEQVSEQSSLTALQRRQEEETDHEREELHRREEILLAGLRDREKAIREEAEVLDKRTIKLDDGRRAYVDRDKYRDAEGRELHDADRAQAEQHQLDQPNAATFQEHQDIERRWRATEELRDKVEALRSAKDHADIPKALAAYETEFKSAVATNNKPKDSVTDYGSADYMSAYGLSGDFKQSATGGSSTPSSLPVPVQPALQKANAFTL